MIQWSFLLFKAIFDLKIPLHFEDIHKVCVTVQIPSSILEKFPNGAPQKSTNGSTQSLLLYKKPNWTRQVAEQQKDTVTSFEDALAKKPKDKTSLAITYFLHASFIQRTSSSGEVKEKGKRKKKNTNKKNQVLLGKPTLHTDVPILFRIQNSLLGQATDGETSAS